ncbi:putative kinase [archaeon BMS3Abin16]|nr:putative kinase [archaeon BMS3Abin16]
MVVLLLTGTPGTGKTSVAGELTKHGFKVIHLNEAVGDDYLYLEGDCKVVDPLALAEKIRPIVEVDSIIEGHLAHLLGIKGGVIVLRTAPEELRSRLRGKGFSEAKAGENVEAEALDVVLIEAMDLYDHVFEVDTTGRTAVETAEDVLKILGGKTKEYAPGRISWLNEYFEQNIASRKYLP